MYASGPFTKVVFAWCEGYLCIGIPRIHPLGCKGDLINIVSHTAPTMWK